MKMETNYPIILVHGMYGFGQDELLDYVLPYWGMFSGDLRPYLRGEGFEVYNPSVGSYSSAWDRACELYAQLTGTTVDYGKAHAEKYGHRRYGRNYPKPLFEEWGSEKKINLVGHSFGGSTIRFLASLMAYGDEAEKQATPENELSELFTGGKADWVYSITCMACVHNGTTLLYSARGAMDKLRMGTYAFANMTGGGAFSKLIQGQMEQWDLNGFENGTNTVKPKNVERRHAAANAKDNVFYDLTLAGNKDVNSRIKIVDSVYYFSFPCRKTIQQPFNSKKKREVPRLSMCPFFWPMSYSIGKYSYNNVDDFPIDENWLPNDGLVPTISETAPIGEPSVDIHDAETIEPGIWNIYDTTPLDHLGIIGGFLPPTNGPKLRKIYRDHFRVVNQLKKD